MIFSYSRNHQKLEHLAKDAGAKSACGSTRDDATRDAETVEGMNHIGLYDVPKHGDEAASVLTPFFKENLGEVRGRK